MSAFKQKNAIASAEFKGFEGIDTTAPHGYIPAAYDMDNFRVLGDGSLQRRCGFAPIAICNSKIRAVWSGKLNGEQLTFVVHNNLVSKIDPISKTLVRIGYLVSTQGHANFLFFNSSLYLIDGLYLYIIKPNRMNIVDGYAPLYGKDWPSAAKGEVNEPLNLATRHIRMTYRITEELIYLCVDHIIATIDAVFVNGVRLPDESGYYFDQSIMCVCVFNLRVGDYVELFLTLEESEIRPSYLFSCQSSVVYGTYADNKIFLWNGFEPDIMYASKMIDTKSLEKAQEIYGQTVPLYFPKDSSFSMSKDGRRITAVCRQYDRLLIFTNTDAWMSQGTIENGNPLQSVTINPSYGCSSDGAVVMCGNDPITVSDGNIMRWTADTDELNECNAYSISEKINPMLKSSFFSNAKILLDNTRKEILFYDPTDSDGTVWIYNYSKKNWFRFTGVVADNMFLCGKNVGFTRDKTVFLFDDALGHDVLPDGSFRTISAFFESFPIDLSVAGNKKRLYGMTLNGTLSNGEVTAEYISNGQVMATKHLSSENNYPISFIKRLNSSRFCYLTLRLSCKGENNATIHSTGVWAKL